MIELNSILQLQANAVIEWHNELILKEEALPWKFIEENHSWNFLLWHEEDIARIKDIDPLRIVEAKRNIDRYNQLRNNAIEKIDEWILSFLEVQNVVSDDNMHSETPGMIIDRLSIMSLKRYHMNEETLRSDASDEHKALCAKKVSTLDEQMADLASCLKGLFAKLELGSLKFKVYRQFKMYNDPSLNPQLYKRAQQING